MQEDRKFKEEVKGHGNADGQNVDTALKCMDIQSNCPIREKSSGLTYINCKCVVRSINCSPISN